MSDMNSDNETHVGVARERSRETMGERAVRTRERLSEAMDDQVRAARRAIRKGRHTAEDLADEVRLEARRNPIQTLGVALGIGAIAGVILGWVMRGPRRRS